jgi:hypothetical protein
MAETWRKTNTLFEYHNILFAFASLSELEVSLLFTGFHWIQSLEFKGNIFSKHFTCSILLEKPCCV